VSDESRLQIRPKDADSSPGLSKVPSGLIARGRREAEALVVTEPTDRLSKVRQLAKEGDMQAQCELGQAYYEGDRVPKDYAEALGWLRKAADQFHLYANTYLGDMYESGEGVPADRAEAVRYYFRAADIAIAIIEEESMSGKIGESRWDSDWLMGAVGDGATHGHAEAARLWRQFADNGWATAQRWHGFIYEEGEGVPQDYAEAVRWYCKAADQGEIYAQRRLGLAYANGRGVTQDYVLAHMWLNLSASNMSGDYQGAKERDEVAGKMTSGQIIEAQRLAQEWKRKTDG
jgi:uncharacterized protein